MPFVGDSSGEWLTEHRIGARVTNVVKCCPPHNQPTAAEVRTCRDAWFDREIAASPARVIVALGRLAHDALVRAPFAHGAAHTRSDGRVVIDSYHPSPLNTRTGRLSRAAFDSVFATARARLA